MREEAAQRVPLVQALEAADRDGQLLTREARAQATAPLCWRRVGRRGVSLRQSPSGGLARGDAVDLAGGAVAAYLDHWRRTAAPLVPARIRLLLHLDAALLALGVLLGACARGVALEYCVTWESTFLGPRELRGVLVALHGRAGAVGAPGASCALSSDLGRFRVSQRRRPPLIGQAMFESSRLVVERNLG